MVKRNNNILLISIICILFFLYMNEKNKNINIYITESETDSDDEFEEPRRHYDSRYTSRKQMEINIPTLGEPHSYQQIGILKGEGEENIRPLYGRQTYRGSNQWNYFTSLDSHLSTKIPVYFDNRDCTDERGCNELQKNNKVQMGEDGNEYSTLIYNTISPRYIPYI